METQLITKGTEVDAVVVTHNSAQDLAALVGSSLTLRAFRRIVVVDNASDDDTVALARAGGLHVVALKVNVGFAAATNIGAAQTEGEVFAVLNPDIAVQSADDIPTLLAHFADRAIGAVAPALRLPDGVIQDSARTVPTPIDLFVRRFANRQPGVVRVDSATDVEWAVGACLLLRRSTFEALGGFSDRFFLYFEDVDFCVRVTEFGQRVRYDPTVVIAHRHRAASRASFLSRATRRHMRSALRFYVRRPAYLVPRRVRRSRRVAACSKTVAGS